MTEYGLFRRFAPRNDDKSRYDFTISQRKAPESSIYLSPHKRAWGMPDARCTRGLVCAL
jgi:hypothetical protein